jgi:hypothetical protein
MASMTDDLPNLLDRIQALVEGRDHDEPERLLERLEHTLTDGYALALALEGERLRLERHPGPTPAGRDRLARIEEDLSRLRDRLRPLKRRTEALAAELAVLR